MVFQVPPRVRMSPLYCLPISILIVIVICLEQHQHVLAAPPKESRQAEPSCHLRELDLCLSSVMVFTQNSNPAPVNEASINRQCTMLNETEGCLFNYTSRCMTEIQAGLVDFVSDGMLESIRQLCTPKGKLREAYLKHGNCLNSQNKAHRGCMRDFQVSLEKVTEIGLPEKGKLGCCAYNRLTSCIHDINLSKCGQESVEVGEAFVRSTFSSLPRVTCSKYDHNSKQCAGVLPPAGSTPKGSKSRSVLSTLFSSYIGN